ncbi:unnamed protein product [Gongylonema pulchrum]|uniref:Uncharacterized protein n=1 Tax=Gongylonema pulchrum TaxID=637853 RepID=A0A3P6TEH6_9BILA|nr:unnamed protein product [Gongylonema pulchrum]
MRASKKRCCFAKRDKNGCLPLHYCFVSLERDVFARMTIDPVAVLSILLDAMQTGVGVCSKLHFKFRRIVGALSREATAVDSAQ